MKPSRMLRTALALAALSAAAVSLAGCIYVDIDRGGGGGYGRRPPPGHYGDGHPRGDRHRGW